MNIDFSKIIKAGAIILIAAAAVFAGALVITFLK
jgi:hypothetical protein